LLIPLLGLAGEAGTLASEYKKQLRDGPANVRFADHVGEELGDLLWYLANVADKMGLSLEDVAKANLVNIADRWHEQLNAPTFFDGSFPESEQLPRQFAVDFSYSGATTATKVVVSRNGLPVGNPLSDNAFEEDGYRFHDIYHFTFAALLAWSPVTRRNLGCKRRSDPRVDEIEDGGRGWVIEEGIALLSFVYAGEHGYFAETERVDQALLNTIRALTRTVEVRIRSAREWERAVVVASQLWKKLRDHDGGSIQCSLSDRRVSYAPPG
jgi:NTP pyrophosphatase (non-canonical NTP hydrolase)